MHSSLRVGLVGYGFAGRTFHAPLIASVDGLELAAIASSDASRVQAQWPGMPVVADYLALATDTSIDLVVIATPNDSHHAIAHAALSAGKHVVVDKPFTVTVAEAEDLIALASKQRRVLSVFHNRRWDGDFLTLQREIAAGALGDVREFVSRFDRFEPQPRDRWRERAGPGAGLWFDLGPHLIDQALCLFGPPLTVSAEIAALRDGAQADDFAQVVLGYERRQVTLHCTRLAAHAAARFEAHGTRGSFHCIGLDTQEDQLRAGHAPGCEGWGEDARPAYVTDGLQSPRETRSIERCPGDYRRYYAAIEAAITGNGANPVPPEQALQVMKILELARQSAEEGSRLRFEDTSRA